MYKKELETMVKLGFKNIGDVGRYLQKTKHSS